VEVELMQKLKKTHIAMGFIFKARSLPADDNCKFLHFYDLHEAMGAYFVWVLNPQPHIICLVLKSKKPKL